MKMSREKKEERWKSRVPAKVQLTEINEHLVCQLCFGYLVDATVITECQHTCEFSFYVSHTPIPILMEMSESIY